MSRLDPGFDEVTGEAIDIAFPEPKGGDMVAQNNITIQHDIITAQKIAVPRNLNKVLADLKILAKMGGDNYYYAWETKNRDGGRGEVFGPTIKLANDVARTYGNCSITCDRRENDTHYLFAARFTDYETGFSMTRMFQQRKEQKTGMKDKDRAEDIIFQIGQSKAIRNVISNALQNMVDFTLEEARSNLVAKFGTNIEAYRTRAIDGIEDRKIPLNDVEKAMGRTAKEWTAKDLARLAGTLQAIKDGMVTVEDVFPTGDAPKEPGQSSAPQPPAPAKKKEEPKAEKAAPEPETTKEGPKDPEPEKTATAKAEPVQEPKKQEPEPEKKAEPLIDDRPIDKTPEQLTADLEEDIAGSLVDARDKDEPDLILNPKKDPRFALLTPTGKKQVMATWKTTFEKFMA